MLSGARKCRASELTGTSSQVHPPAHRRLAKEELRDKQDDCKPDVVGKQQA